MEYLKKLKYLVLFLLLSSFIHAQSARIDSLEAVLKDKSSLSDTEVFATINYLFEEFAYRQDSTQSLFYAELLIEEATKRKNPSNLKQGHYYKAYVRYHQFKEKIQSRAFIDSLLQEAILAKDYLMIGLCYDLIRYDYAFIQQDSMYYYCEKAYHHLNKTNSPRIVIALTGLAYAEGLRDTRNGFQKSKKWGDMAVEKARQLDNPVWLMIALRRKANTATSLSNLQEASDLLIEAINLGEKHDYSYDLIECYGMIADLSDTKNDTLNTLKYAERAYQLAQKGVLKFYKSQTATILAAYFNKYEIKRERCEELFAFGHKMGQEMGIKYLLIQNHLFYGDYYVKEEQIALAKKHYIKGITISEEEKNHTLTRRIQARLSDLLVDEPSDSLGIVSFLQADSIQDSDLLYAKLYTSKIHLNTAKKNNDHQKALFWLEQLIEVQELMHERDLKISVQEQLLAQEVENQEKELTLKEALVKATIFKNRVLSAASILATLLVGILWYLFRDKKRQHRIIAEKNVEISETNITIAALNEDLQNKNKLLQKEVTDYIAFQSGRDQQLNEIKKEIDKIEDNDNQRLMDWKIIQSKFNSILDNEDKWLVFKRKIENLYPNFFTNLALKHPNLSKREMTHCAYMLIGMSCKQVAESLYIAPKTVESARYRVKKKIGLDKSMDLTEYVKGV